MESFLLLTNLYLAILLCCCCFAFFLAVHSFFAFSPSTLSPFQFHGWYAIDMLYLRFDSHTFPLVIQYKDSIWKLYFQAIKARNATHPPHIYPTHTHTQNYMRWNPEKRVELKNSNSIRPFLLQKALIWYGTYNNIVVCVYIVHSLT